MPVAAPTRNGKAPSSSKKKTWVAKEDAVEQVSASTIAAPVKPPKGRQQRVTDASLGGKTSKTSIGKMGPRSRGTKLVQASGHVGNHPAKRLSVDEVQHGLTMLLHQFKSATQDETYATSMTYEFSQEHLNWAAPLLQHQLPWEAHHPWDPSQHWAATTQQQPTRQAGTLLLRQLQSGGNDVPLSVIESDEGTSIPEKIYGRGFLLRARRSLVCRPEGSAYDGPKWNVGPRPLELNVEIGVDASPLGMPRSPPPVAPPSFHLDVPSFELEPAPAWDPFTDPASVDYRYLTPDMSMTGYMSAYQDSADMAWQAHAESYYPSCDANGMPFLLPEVPTWPFNSSALTADVFVPQGGKLDGHDMEDSISTAASSGQPSSVTHSPLHAPLEPSIAVKARLQVEYYLSVENLIRDPYLCSQLDEDGWVSLDVLATFPRMQRIGLDAAGIAAALAGSTQLEDAANWP